MEPVASHAKNLEQEAARTFAEAQKRVSDSEQQLLQLEDFRAEYLTKYQSASQKLDSMSQILDYQAFLAKLSVGIGQANSTINLCRQQRDILKQQWLQRRVRSQALDSVVEKYQKVELKHEDHIEQMELEELTLHRYHSSQN